MLRRYSNGGAEATGREVVVSGGTNPRRKDKL